MTRPRPGASKIGRAILPAVNRHHRSRCQPAGRGGHGRSVGVVRTSPAGHVAEQIRCAGRRLVRTRSVLRSVSSRVSSIIQLSMAWAGFSTAVSRVRWLPGRNSPACGEAPSGPVGRHFRHRKLSDERGDVRPDVLI